MYDQKYIFRVELPIQEKDSKLEDQENLYIANSYITEANFLFVSCETASGYHIYQFDLD